MSDPLSFFAGDDSSDSESENEDNKARKQDAVPSSLPPTSDNKLPSPNTLFASVGKPSFLNNSSRSYVNWDKFLKNDAEPVEPNIHLSGSGQNYAAIAPPKDLNDESSSSKRKVHSSLTAAIVNTYSNTGGEISAPPVRYSTEDVDPKFRMVSDEGGVASSEVPPISGKHNMSDLEVEGSSKKQKTENFRQKEKRKRDSGQTSRGKSYVEEEKRVLRQQFGADEVMS